MPIVTVVMTRHAEMQSLLAAIADAIASVLELGPGGVIARAMNASPGVGSGITDTNSQPEWPIITIHGEGRGLEVISAARSAASSAFVHWAAENGFVYEGVWSEWTAPQPKV